MSQVTTTVVQTEQAAPATSRRVDVIKMADAIRESIKIEDGAQVVPEQTYIEQAGQRGLTEVVIEGVHNFDHDYRAASVRAIGAHHIAMIQTDPETTTHTASVAMGVETLKITTQKERTYPGVNGGAATTKYGVTSVTVEGSVKGREMSAARRAIQEEASKLWGPQE